MRNDYGLQFKTFVPSLVELLEDADGMVRDVARNTVIELFKDATGPAKSDLKRQLRVLNVRPAIVSAIMDHIGSNSHAAAEYPEESAPVSRNERPIFGKSLTTPALAERPVTPLPERSEHVEPLIMDTQRELEDTFREMCPFFEGKESEQNWLKREQSCTKIRRLNAGNSPSEFTEMWVASIKGLLDGILKAVNSLRTSLSKEGCALLQEVAKTTKSGLDGMVEILLQNLVKLCGGTKKIASAAGDATIDIIISNVSYNKRILEHIYLACQDKNVQPRTYAAGWLRTLLKKEAHHKNHVEHSGGVDLIEKCIKKGLADANPGVRERMRGTFWIFAGMWPARSDALQATLDGVQLKLLQNDPNNPNSPKKPEAVVRPGLGFSKSTMGASKPSVREAMLAQKKALIEAKKTHTATLPVRPGSAMSSFQSPMKSSSSTTSISSTATSRSRPEGTSSVAHGGLSVAPMRPARRTNAPPRPATAGPYDVRPKPNATHTSTTTAPLATPGPASRIKPRTPATATTAAKTSPKRAPMTAPFPRPNTAQSNHASQSSSTSPSRENPIFARETRAESPQLSPPRTIPQPSPKWHPQQSPRLNPYNSPVLASPTSSKMKPPSKFHMSGPISPSRSPTRNTDEDFTMVIPNLSKLSADQPQLATSPVIKEARQSIPAKSAGMQIFEDPFSATAAKLDGPSDRPANRSPVLGEVEMNGDVPKAARKAVDPSEPNKPSDLPPQKIKQNQTMLDSGIKRINAQSLGVHEFRGLQKLIKNSDHTLWADGRFSTLLGALFGHLEAPLKDLSPEKAQDVKAQLLSTIKIMLKKNRDAVGDLAPQGIDSLLVARAQHEARAHIVPGYELLAKELIQIGDSDKIANIIISRLQSQEQSHEGNRTLTMGLQTLSKMMDTTDFNPSAKQVEQMGILGTKCIRSSDSGVRKSAMEFCCLSLHSRIGDEQFWGLMGGADEDLKKLMTYYLKVKTARQQ